MNIFFYNQAAITYSFQSSLPWNNEAYRGGLPSCSRKGRAKDFAHSICP